MGLQESDMIERLSLNKKYLCLCQLLNEAYILYFVGDKNQIVYFIHGFCFYGIGNIYFKQND